MERIAKLLFALTLLSIFSYMLIYASMSSAGNGGEYWGFDGHVEPHTAAGASFDAGVFELLALDMANPLGGRVVELPETISCTSDSGSISTSIRVNAVEGIHSDDSVRLAKEFSRQYNRYMSGMIQSMYGYSCSTGNE